VTFPKVTNLFQKEGSSPPQDLTMSLKAAKPNGWNILVLDIASSAVLRSVTSPWCSEGRGETRKSTETWKFTDNGRLVCTHRGLQVQAKDGFKGEFRMMFQG